MSDIEKNKAVVRRYFDAFNAGDFNQLDDIVAQDYGDKLEGQRSGIEVIRSYLAGLKHSFPDFTWTIEKMIAEGDHVAVMNNVSGTQVNEFGDIKATGNHVSFKAFQFYRLENGKLAEHWEIADFQKFQEQLLASPQESAFKKFQSKLRGR